MLDFHNHIIPGIDDGSPDCAMSEQLIQGLKELGFDEIIGSPHIIMDTHPNNKETISEAFLKLNEHQASNHSMSLSSYAAEYMMDDTFLAKLNQKVPLLCIKENIVLVELSYAHKPDHLETMSFQLQIEGYIPILAHPERYIYYHKDYKTTYTYLKDLGFDLQLNLLSLTPYYGKEVQNIALKLLNDGLYDFACTDLHHLRHLEALQFLSNEYGSMKELFQKYNFRNSELSLRQSN